jgi:hypothetical protein
MYVLVPLLTAAQEEAAGSPSIAYYIGMAIPFAVLLAGVVVFVVRRRPVRCLNATCGAKLHHRAVACPRCGTATALAARNEATDAERATRQYGCRNCGTSLVIREHVRRWESYSDAVVRGTTVGGTAGVDYDKLPCRSCGDPTPLKRFAIRHGFWLATTFGLLLLGAVPQILWEYHHDHPGASEWIDVGLWLLPFVFLVLGARLTWRRFWFMNAIPVVRL